jgi:DnaD/phage-associated family protein
LDAGHGKHDAEDGAAFAGFPAVFFSDLLPRLAGDAVALGVTLYAFKALQSKRGTPRYVTADELAADPALAQYLANAGADDGVEHGLRRAAELGVLLPLALDADGRRVELYFLNSAADRRGIEIVRAGGIDVGRVIEMPAAKSERSGVFALYESLVGTISPLIADELAEAERLYPAEWLEAAFREAAAQNARSWRYVSRILERWAIEGPDHAKTERDPAAEEHYFSGKYGRILRQRFKP